MGLKETFEALKPILDTYIEQKIPIQKRITQLGTLPEEIISECPIRNIVNLNKFDEATLTHRAEFVHWLKENEISVIQSNGNEIYLRAKVERINGKSGARTPESIIMSSRGLKENEIIEYEFHQSVSSFKKKEIYQFLSKYAFNGISTCRHIDENTASDAFPIVITKKPHAFVIISRENSLEALSGERQTTNLQLLCSDCYQRIDKLCCDDALTKRGIGYTEHHNPSFDYLLTKLLLKKHNVDFKEYGDNDRFSRETPVFFLSKFNVLLTMPHREIENAVETLKPEVVIIQGKKEDIASYLKFNTDLIIFDGSEKADQRYFLFDKEKTVETDIEKCCLHIIENLEKYSEEIRGKEHDKIIESLVKIGKDLGFIPHRELENKGARVDVAWLNRDGSVFSALEVETSSQWKKDVVTTWETEPRLAVIVSHYKSEKGIKDILRYVLLKHMPHKLLFINNLSKKAYLIEKQEIRRYYDLNKKAEIPKSEVFEY